MRVVITAATVGEWMPAFVHLKDLYIGESERLKVHFYQSGVGMLATSMALTRLVLNDKPDLIIQMGIAGSFKSTLAPGAVMVVKDEQLGDMGVEENGEWKDILTGKYKVMAAIQGEINAEGIMKGSALVNCKL